MITSLGERGQTVVPVELREKYGLDAHSKLQWIDDNGTIRVVPLSGDPITALRGSLKGIGLTKALLRQRAKDTKRE